MKTENIYLKIRNKQALVSVSFKGPNLFILYIYIYIYICKELFLAKTHTPPLYKKGGAINEQWTLNSWLLHLYLSIFIKRERESWGDQTETVLHCHEN